MKTLPVVAPERFAAFVVKAESGCHVWTGRQFNGYGLWETSHFAHRVAYSIYRGPIPAGLEIDHLCRNRLCVNAEHLEPVTRKENQDRAFAVIVPARTHCKRGHLWTPENTIRWRRYRYCRECARNGWRAYGRRRRGDQTKNGEK